MDDNNNQDGEQIVIFEEKITKVNGEVAIKRYQRGKFLGKGGFAKCYEATNLENKKVMAAKIIAKSSLTRNRARQKLVSEIKIHKSLQNSNVVQFEHVFEDHENVYILLELCCNQTLNELIKRRKRLTEIEVQCYVAQMINALKYLHNNNVIHRDLKLGNLFLNKNMELKLGDFGLATKLEFEGEKKRTICGTPNYIAPEVLDGKVGHSFEVDVWSLGVIIYAMLIGKPPFETPDVKSTYKKIKMNQYSFPDQVQISDNAKQLIQKILVLEPSKRPSLDEIMAHSFMNSGGTIPKVLPLSTLACPPSIQYNKQFQQPSRASETAQSNPKMATVRPNISSERQDQFGATSGLNTGYNGGYNSSQRPSSQKPQDFKQSVSTKSLNQFYTSGTIQNAQSSKQKNEIFVRRWVDYSSKYGLGYLLSNGATGVFFNDSTKIILDPRTQEFEYLERKGADKQDAIDKFSINSYPKELQKKVTLLQHFKSYLDADSKTITSSEITDYDPFQSVYVKKWMKTRHAIMFRLSNKIVQVFCSSLSLGIDHNHSVVTINFTDKTEIILSSENKLVTYVNKLGERSHYPLATALDSQNHEMAKRLKYTKEILTHMLNGNTNVDIKNPE